MYHDTQASVRGSEGYGLPFPIDVDVRKGGVEPPHLYIICVCNVIVFLNSVASRDGGAHLKSIECRALPLDNDLVIISQSEED